MLLIAQYWPSFHSFSRLRNVIGYIIHCTLSAGLAHYADGTKEERKVHAAAADKASEAVQGDNFGGHKDSMPRGARSVGLDIAFPYAQHVYGEFACLSICGCGLLYCCMQSL